MSRRITLLLLTVGLLLAPGAARAGEAPVPTAAASPTAVPVVGPPPPTPPPPPPPPPLRLPTLFADLEKALEAEALGNDGEAVAAFGRAYHHYLAPAGPAGGRPEVRSALAEFCLLQLGVLAPRAGRCAEALEILDAAPANLPTLHLEAAADRCRARFQRRLGRLEEAEATAARLGLVTHFLIAGPFDNQQGVGYDTAYPPEEGFDRAAKFRGKAREIAWRDNENRHRLGYIDLDATFRPNDHCLAYAAATVTVAERREAALRLATDEGFKLWVNGRLLRERQVRRICTWDQETVGVVLEPGANLILLKLADTDGPWGFRLRLTDPAGGPLAGAELGVPAAGFAPPAAATAAAAKPEAAAAEIFAALTREEPDNAWNWFLLGASNLLLRTRSENDEEFYGPLLEALRRPPNRPLFAYYLGRALEPVTARGAGREENHTRTLMDQAAERDQRQARALLWLARYYADSLGSAYQAQKRLDRARQSNPRFAEAGLLQVELHLEAGAEAAAVSLTRELLEQHPGHPAVLALAGRELLGGPDPRRAVELLRRALAADFWQPGARADLFAGLTMLGETEAARQALSPAIAANPFDREALRLRAESFADEERFAEAAAEVERMLAICPEDDQAYALLGRLRHRAGEEEAAFAAWDRALALNPADEGTRRYVEFLRPEEQPFEEDFPVDVADLIRRAPEPVPGGPPTVNLLDRRIVFVNEDGTLLEFTHRVFKVMSEREARRQQSEEIYFYPTNQVARVRLARVHHPDGSVDDARIVRLAGDPDAEYPRPGRVVLRLPPLAPGDVVELKYRKDDFRQSFFGDYVSTSYLFGDVVPTMVGDFILIWPRARALHLDVDPSLPAATESAWRRDSHAVYHWARADIPATDVEEHLPPLYRILPAVNVSSFGRWSDLGNWYWQLISEQYDQPRAMAERVQEVINRARARTDEEKIRAIYEFVANDIRYHAFSLGLYGFRPFRASTVLTRGYGDCKDKTALLVSMLALAGIEAHPVLLYAADPGEARGEEDFDLPSLRRFNHCIAMVPREGQPPLWLDGTAINYPLETTPRLIRGARVLVVEPGASRLETIPDAQPENDYLQTRLRTTVGPGRPLTLNLNFQARDRSALELRNEFINPRTRQDNIRQRYEPVFGELSVLFADFDHLDEISPQLAGNFRLQAAAPAPGADGEIALPLNVNTASLAEYATRTERRTPLHLVAALERELVLEVTVLPPLAVRSLPPAVDLSGPWGRLEVSCDQRGNQITYRRRIAVQPAVIAPADYPAFREFCAAVDRATGRRIRLGEQAAAPEEDK